MALTDMLHLSARYCLFCFSGAGHKSNSACRIFSSWVEVLLLLRRARGALSILGSFLGKVSCEWVMNANARFLSFVEGVIIALAADRGVKTSDLLLALEAVFVLGSGVEGDILISVSTNAATAVCLRALSTDLGLGMLVCNGGSLITP